MGLTGEKRFGIIKLRFARGLPRLKIWGRPCYMGRPLSLKNEKNGRTSDHYHHPSVYRLLALGLRGGAIVSRLAYVHQLREELLKAFPLAQISAGLLASYRRRSEFCRRVQTQSGMHSSSELVDFRIECPSSSALIRDLFVSPLDRRSCPHLSLDIAPNTGQTPRWARPLGTQCRDQCRFSSVSPENLLMDFPIFQLARLF